MSSPFNPFNNVRVWVPSEQEERPENPNHYVDFSMLTDSETGYREAAEEYIAEMEIMSQIWLTEDQPVMVLVEDVDEPGVHEVEVHLVMKRTFVGQLKGSTH